jgi:solute carrier family 30 (zinc transporter), member 9
MQKKLSSEVLHLRSIAATWMLRNGSHGDCIFPGCIGLLNHALLGPDCNQSKSQRHFGFDVSRGFSCGRQISPSIDRFSYSRKIYFENRRMKHHIGTADSTDQKNELKAVNTAVVANGAIFTAKMGAWYFSGSGVLLAESVHSLADIANQLLLKAGVEKSRRAPTKQHPYGFHREKYIYALMSAVSVFCLGSGATIVHGVQALIDPPTLEHMEYSLYILGLSAAIEAYSLRVAYKILTDGATKSGKDLLAHIRSGRDPATSAVLAEDTGAVIGLGIAGVASYLTLMTGDPMYDALGSIGVGLLMGGVALALIRNYKRFLIGQAIEPTLQKALVNHLKSDPMVLCVLNPMSEEIGDGLYRFKADIQWNGDRIVHRYLESLSREEIYKDIMEAACAAPGNENEMLRDAMDMALIEFGRGIISTVGEEIDRLEAELTKICPGLMYVDLETERILGASNFLADRCMLRIVDKK